MFCRKCGHKLNEGDMFCVKCGAKVESSELYSNAESMGKEACVHSKNAKSFQKDIGLSTTIKKKLVELKEWALNDEPDTEGPSITKKEIIGSLVCMGILIIAFVIVPFLYFQACEEAQNAGKEYTYEDYISRGDSYLEDGNELKARKCYNKAIEKDKSTETAYEKLLNLYIDSVETKKIERIISRIDKNISCPSKELESLVDKWRDRDWYVIEAISKDSDGEETVTGTFEYDNEGRIVKDNIGDICKTLNDPNKQYYYTYEYLSDDRILITDHYLERDDEAHKLCIIELYEDGTPYSTQYFNCYGELRDDDEICYYTRENDRVYTGFLDRYYDLDYNENVRHYGGKDYDNMYDVNDNLVWRNIYDKNDNYIGETEYVYVYCKKSDLNGDLSGFPKTDKELTKERGYNKLENVIARDYGKGYTIEEMYDDELEGMVAYCAYKDSSDEEDALWYEVNSYGRVFEDD